MNNNNANERIVNSSIQQEEHLQSEDQTNLQTSNIRDYIIEAVALAYQAVQEDNGNENNLENSRGLYRECAERLEHIKPFVPEEHAKVLNKFVSSEFYVYIFVQIYRIYSSLLTL
jgi:hypothetical protein